MYINANGICFVDIVLLWGKGVDWLSEGVELHAVHCQGFEYLVEQLAHAIKLGHDQDIELTQACGLYHQPEGFNLSLCFVQLDVFGARLARDDEGSGGFDPAA